MADLIELASGHPLRTFEAGETIIHEGGRDGALWVLVSGALGVHKGDVAINTVTEPGALIGEVSVLLEAPHSATVSATEPSSLRYIEDGAGWLSSNPGAARLVAVGLAQRLSFLTTYLTDLTHQYGDAPGLTMVSEVLRELSQRRGPVVTPGSAREPDPEY